MTLFIFTYTNVFELSCPWKNTRFTCRNAKIFVRGRRARDRCDIDRRPETSKQGPVIDTRHRIVSQLRRMCLSIPVRVYEKPRMATRG